MRIGTTTQLAASTSGRTLTAVDRALCCEASAGRISLASLKLTPGTASLRCSAVQMETACNSVSGVHTTINPWLASVTVSKTMALTDLATELRDKGVDVISLAAGEPDFDTPATVTEAGIQALRHALWQNSGLLDFSRCCVCLTVDFLAQRWAYALHTKCRAFNPQKRHCQETAAGKWAASYRIGHSGQQWC